MILHARRTSYRPAHLRPLLERDRSLFEHWTHDAAIIPTEFYPHWRLRFDRDSEALKARWKNWRRDGFEERFEEVLTQIAATALPGHLMSARARCADRAAGGIGIPLRPLWNISGAAVSSASPAARHSARSMT